MDKKFNVSIWDLINIENLNNLLEKVIDEDATMEGIPSDIQYHCITITRDGTLTLDSEFELEKI